MNTIKKTAAVLIAILIIASTLVSCGKKDPDAPDGYTKISADGVGYTFYMPENWTMTQQTGITSAKVSEFDNSNVSMMGFDAAGTDSAESYWEKYKSDLESAFDGITYVEENSDTMIGGKNAKKYIYTVNLSGNDYKIMQIVYCNNNATLFTAQPEVYVFTYTALSSQYDLHIEEVIEIVDNVVFD